MWGAALRQGDWRGYHNSVSKRRRPEQNTETAPGGQAAPGAQAASGVRGERPSKSQLKREMSELQALGERLIALPPAKLRAMPIGENLIDAVQTAQRITAHEGLRRQRQYIGKLMREVDPQPLRDALDADGAQHRVQVQAMHAAERWRERLVNEPAALAAFEAAHPGAGETVAPLVAKLRARAGAAPDARAYRALYRSLLGVLSGEPDSTTPLGKEPR